MAANIFKKVLGISLAILLIGLVLQPYIETATGFADFLLRPKAMRHLHSKSEYVAANHDIIQYNGRWVSAPNQLGRYASFGGSSFEFSVCNTKYVYLVLENRKLDNKLHEIQSGVRPQPITLADRKTLFTQAGYVSFYHTINGSSKAMYHQDVNIVAPLATELDRNAIHTFKVTLPYHESANVLQLQEIWTFGGQLLPPMASIGDVLSVKELDKNSITKDWRMAAPKTARTLIEIMSPSNMLMHACPSSSSKNKSKSWAQNWPTLLENGFTSSSFSTVPISPAACLTSRCGDSTTRPQTTFMRSGPPNSTLHSHRWSFMSATSKPGALILTLGVSDVEHFLSMSSHGKHDFTAFIDDLSHQYSTFIQMLRRTVYSPSSLASGNSYNPSSNSHRLQPNDDRDGYIDESHLYNSAASTLPIFIVLPPIPSILLLPHARQLRSILHHTATKTLNDLKWHIGDTHTIIIDTTGWLADEDFTYCSSDSSPSPINIDTNADPAPSTASTSMSDYVLTQSGHVKFAHHMSLHLCPYLAGAKEKCAFEKHGEYTGNLVVPEVDSVGKVMEGKRVGRIKEVFGMDQEGRERME